MMPFIQQNALQRVRVIRSGKEVFDKTIDLADPNALSKVLSEARALVEKLSVCRGCGERHGFRYDQYFRTDICKGCGFPT